MLISIWCVTDASKKNTDMFVSPALEVTRQIQPSFVKNATLLFTLWAPHSRLIKFTSLLLQKVKTIMGIKSNLKMYFLRCWPSYKSVTSIAKSSSITRRKTWKRMWHSNLQASLTGAKSVSLAMQRQKRTSLKLIRKTCSTFTNLSKNYSKSGRSHKQPWTQCFLSTTSTSLKSSQSCASLKSSKCVT